jgi:phage baseplate assembly protein W
LAVTPQTKTSEIYSDFQTNLTVHPIKKDLTRLTNEDAVKRSIKNILLTNHYERPFRPRFGANLRKYLFENIDSIVIKHIENDILTAIENYEPRANVIKITVTSNPDNNAINASIIFSTINSLQTVTLNTIIALDRVR